MSHWVERPPQSLLTPSFQRISELPGQRWRVPAALTPCAAGRRVTPGALLSAGEQRPRAMKMTADIRQRCSPGAACAALSCVVLRGSFQGSCDWGWGAPDRKSKQGKFGTLISSLSLAAPGQSWLLLHCLPQLLICLLPVMDYNSQKPGTAAQAN